MPTGRDLVSAAFALMREHPPQWYSKQEPRNQPPWTHHADCSGGLCYLLNAVGVPYPESNSWNMAVHCHQLGLGISLEEARHTPGAWFIIGANEGQTNIQGLGHIGMFVGDGIHTFEWRGRYAGVGVFDYRSHYRIDYCAHAPGINYSPTKPLPPIVVPKEKKHSMGMIVLPNTKLTPVGRAATAVEDFTHNRVLLEDGARLVGDHPTGDGHEHYWEPDEKDQIPGWSLVGIAPGPTGVFTKYPKYIVVRYAWGDNNGGTYIATVSR